MGNFRTKIYDLKLFFDLTEQKVKNKVVQIKHMGHGLWFLLGGPKTLKKMSKCRPLDGRREKFSILEALKTSYSGFKNIHFKFVLYIYNV